MHVGVFLKWVIDPQARFSVSGEGSVHWEPDAAHVINEPDEAALAAALALREARPAVGGAAGGAEEDDNALRITAVCLGSHDSEAGLRKGLALGCERAVRVDAGGRPPEDPRARARLLAAAARRLDLDLALVGAQSSDSSFGLTGPWMAVELGWSSAWLALDVTLDSASDGEGFTVVRELEQRRRERLWLPRPAVVAVQTGVHRPRMASIRGVLAAKKRPIEVWTPDDLGVEVVVNEQLRIGAPHPPTRGASNVEWIEGAPEQAARTLIAKLREEGWIE